MDLSVRTGGPTIAAGRSPGAAIHVAGLTHRYRTVEGELRVLQGVDLEVVAGGYVSISGPSGAGKSTLLSILGGLEAPQEGTVRVDEVNVSALRGDGLAAYRRDTVGFVFQHFGLLETLTARENVELAMTLAGWPPSRRSQRAGELLDEVGLAGRSNHRPTRLSGGERQRVAIARALANEPRIVLADEPTGNLDEVAAVQVVELLERFHAERTCTLVMVTHNRALAERADRRLWLRDGRLHDARPERG